MPTDASAAMGAPLESTIWIVARNFVLFRLIYALVSPLTSKLMVDPLPHSVVG